VERVASKETLFLKYLKHPGIRQVRSKGLMIALEFDSFEENKRVIDTSIKNGIFTDWFLFHAQSMRIVPPLNISDEDIRMACGILMESI
jgi:acetylornithine/succinyldiaminopimelate/putrescine aminotransferase